jgi:nicotinate dehydrogenase subunit B
MMQARHLTRRDVLRGTGELGISFNPWVAIRRDEGKAHEATATISSRATPGGPTVQQVQMRDVSGDTVDSWLEIDADGHVTVYAGKVELGTGLRTALGQIVAEELDVPFDRVNLIIGDTALTPNQGGTMGSKSVQVAGPVLRQATAEARLELLTRASNRLGVPVDGLRVKDGVVSALGDKALSASYGELAVEPIAREASGGAPVKHPSQYKIVGQAVKRVDIPGKLTGDDKTYVHDVWLDGMLHGRVVRPYVRTLDGVGAIIGSFDDSAAKAAPGVVEVVRNGNFIGVVAEREEQAIQAAEAIKVTWTQREALPSHDQIFDLIREMPLAEDQGGEILHNGDVDTALGIAAQTLEATYNFPAQAHGMMGPSCAVADVHPEGATIYSQSQNVYSLGETLADLLGFAPEQVRVIFREGAGCYGHSGADDVAADAALLSKSVGRPVRVQWMRQQEFAWEPKSPPMVMDLRGGLDEDGNILAWDYELWTATFYTRPRGLAAAVLAGQLIDPPAAPLQVSYGGGDRNAPTNYAFPNNRVTVHWVKTPPLRSSALRSLGGFANTTANESFIDELAAAAGADPVAFRLRHLSDPRAIEVIQKAAEVAGWEARPSGPRERPAVGSSELLQGRGIAFVRYETEYTYVAVVAEVEVEPTNGNTRVTRVVVGHDCGLIINPDGLTNQIEGNVIQGISRALKEEVTWDDHAVTSVDWSTYHILTFAEAPAIELALIDRPEEPALGAGEPAICPVAAAVGNAIFDATGVRLRTAPFTPERVLAELGGATN